MVFIGIILGIISVLGFGFGIFSTIRCFKSDKSRAEGVTIIALLVSVLITTFFAAGLVVTYFILF